MDTETPPDSDPLREAAHELLGVVRLLARERQRPIALGFDPAALAVVGNLRDDHGLPPSYTAFLSRWASEDFVDSGLTCNGVACWISTAAGFVSLHESYADQEDWPSDWLVVAGEHEGCYVLAGDGTVSFLGHGDGHDATPVADSFTAFLVAVATSSKPRSKREPGVVRAARQTTTRELASCLRAKPSLEHLRWAWATAADVEQLDALDLIEALTPLVADVDTRVAWLAARRPAPGASPLSDRLLPLATQAGLDAALLGASRAGHLSWLNDLLPRGADPNTRKDVRVGGELTGATLTPLSESVRGGHIACSRLLLSHGADATVEAIIEQAAAAGDHEHVQLLLDHGARLGDAQTAEDVIAAVRATNEDASATEPERRMPLGKELGCYLGTLLAVALVALLLWAQCR